MVNRISGQNGLSPVIKQKNLHKKYDVTQSTGTTDEVKFSPFAKELARIMGELEHVSDVRQDKVDEFKKQVTEGTYKPDLANVAKSLLIAGLLNGEE
ncbi:MAG: flagellar biosynthesis anti-sigma factor FlgM [Synergistaceae bacterium]|nr:flagellar biosynthesis anti-sigma factor FlgM [Synergistaceae bacterium]